MQSNVEQHIEAIQKAQQAAREAMEAGVNPDKVIDSVIQTAIDVERSKRRC